MVQDTSNNNCWLNLITEIVKIKRVKLELLWFYVENNDYLRIQPIFFFWAEWRRGQLILLQSILKKGKRCKLTEFTLASHSVAPVHFSQTVAQRCSKTKLFSKMPQNSQWSPLLKKGLQLWFFSERCAKIFKIKCPI